MPESANPSMVNRISAGVLIVQDGKVLMVRHVKPKAYDFWVAPGGGALEGEDLVATAKREAWEETGLLVEVQKLVYLEEFTSPTVRHCKAWFLARVTGGELSWDRKEATEEFIVEARFLSREEMRGKEPFPAVLRDTFWDDLAKKFPEPRYLGLRKMRFW